MSSTKRRILLAIFSILFIFLGIGAVFYTDGWRIDWKNFKFLRVGGIYVKTYPSRADIFLDGKSIKRGFSLFDSGVLINGLFPKEYILEIKNENYLPWKRNIVVEPALVSEVKYAVLVPKQKNEVLKSNFKNFFVLSNDDVIFLNSQNNIIFENFILKGQEIMGFSSDFSKVLTYDSKNKFYWLEDLKNSTSTNLSLTIKKINPKLIWNKAYFPVDASNELVILDKETIYLFDLNKSKLNFIATSSLPIENSASSRFWLVWSVYDSKSNQSTFYIHQKVPLVLNKKFVLDQKNKSLVIKNNNLFILQENGALYRYDLIGEVNSNIATDVLDFYLSDDGSMLAALESKALEIFNLKDKSDYFRFDFPQAKDVLKIIWYRDNRHLFLLFKDKTQFMEIEDKFKENIQDIVETSNVFYNPKSNRLYFVENNVLKFIEFP